MQFELLRLAILKRVFTIPTIEKQKDWFWILLLFKLASWSFKHFRWTNQSVIVIGKSDKNQLKSFTASFFKAWNKTIKTLFDEIKTAVNTF